MEKFSHYQYIYYDIFNTVELVCSHINNKKFVEAKITMSKMHYSHLKRFWKRLDEFILLEPWQIAGLLQDIIDVIKKSSIQYNGKIIKELFNIIRSFKIAEINNQLLEY